MSYPPHEIQKSLARTKQRPKPKTLAKQWQDLHGECGDVELRHQDIGHQLAFGFERLPSGELTFCHGKW